MWAIKLTVMASTQTFIEGHLLIVVKQKYNLDQYITNPHSYNME